MSSPNDLAALGGTAMNVIGTVAVTKIAADSVSRTTRGIKHPKGTTNAYGHLGKSYKTSGKHMSKGKKYNVPNNLSVIKMKKMF